PETAAKRKKKTASDGGNPSEGIGAPCCPATTSLSETLPATSSTATVLIPIAISYEINCAEARRPPSRAYLLLDDHPASTMPYTPSEEIARMYRNPTGRSATTSGTSPHLVCSGAPNGHTANVSTPGVE